MNWHTRLTQAREAKNLKKSAFAKLVGVSAPTVTDWENGQTKMIEGSNLIKVCEVLEIQPEWLLHGSDDAEPRLPGSRRVMPVGDGDDDPYTYSIPRVMLRLQAGINGVQTEPDRRHGGKLRIDRRFVEGNSLNPERLIAIQVRGESMEPNLYDGDTIVVDLDDTRPVDGRVYAINYEGEAVVKRMSRDAGEWWLTSDNPDQRRYHRKLCRGGDCIIVGRVIQKISMNI